MTPVKVKAASRAAPRAEVLAPPSNLNKRSSASSGCLSRIMGRQSAQLAVCFVVCCCLLLMIVHVIVVCLLVLVCWFGVCGAVVGLDPLEPDTLEPDTPPPDNPKFRSFFPLPPPFRSFCLSLCVFSLNFGGVCEDRAVKCARSGSRAVV